MMLVEPDLMPGLFIKPSIQAHGATHHQDPPPTCTLSLTIQAVCATYATRPPTATVPCTLSIWPMRAEMRLDLPLATLPTTMVSVPGCASRLMSCM